MTIKVIIFDFDGTIADTFDVLVQITNRLATEFGYKQSTLEEINYLRNLTSRQIVKASGVSLFKIPFLLRRVKTELKNEILSVNLIPGMKEVLIDLANQGNQLGIITSNSKENVTLFLEHHHLKEAFSFICSGTTLFGKNHVINSFLREKNLHIKQVVYVGDETRDIEAAKRSKIPMIAVSWGYNFKEVLMCQKPDFLIEQPKELIDVISKLQAKEVPTG
jgi:phosphoglycolate phosphatase